MNTQLLLGIALRDDATFDNYYPANNEQVILQLRRIARGVGEYFIYLWGAKGAGVSHLLQACCLDSAHSNEQAIYLPLSDASLTPEILQNLEAIDLICLDDVDAVVFKKNWCEALFHLYNRVRDSNSRLLIGASQSPIAIQCALLDLRSRLCAGLTFQVHSLTDEDKLKALQLRARQRGLELPRDVGLFILSHCPRDMSALYRRLQEIDEASLIAKRRLTIPFVKQVLLRMSSES